MNEERQGSFGAIDYQSADNVLVYLLYAFLIFGGGLVFMHFWGNKK